MCIHNAAHFFARALPPGRPRARKAGRRDIMGRSRCGRRLGRDAQTNRPAKIAGLFHSGVSSTCRVGHHSVPQMASADDRAPDGEGKKQRLVLRSHGRVGFELAHLVGVASHRAPASPGCSHTRPHGPDPLGPLVDLSIGRARPGRLPGGGQSRRHTRRSAPLRIGSAARRRGRARVRSRSPALRRAITERHDPAGNYPQLDVVGDGLLGHPLEPFAGLAQLALLGEADVEAHPG